MTFSYSLLTHLPPPPLVVSHLPPRAVSQLALGATTHLSGEHAAAETTPCIR